MMKNLLLTLTLVALSSCSSCKREEPPKKVINGDSIAYKAGNIIQSLKESYNRGKNDAKSKTDTVTSNASN